MNNKVLYAWYADSLPFYIGIGSVKRSQSRHKRNAYCLNKRSKAERENCFEIRILHCNLSWEQACELEQSYISLYGRADNRTGILTNMTDGGDGNWNPSKETRDKISEAKKGANNPNYGKTGKESNMFGTTFTKETRQKMRANSGMKGLKEGRHPRSKSVHTPLGDFESCVSAAKAHDIHKREISRRVRNEKLPEYFYL